MKQLAKEEGTFELLQLVAEFNIVHDRFDFAVVAVEVDEIEWTLLELATVKAQLDGMFGV